MKSGKVALFVVVFSLSGMSQSWAQREKPILVAAASDLKFALDSLIAAYSSEHSASIEPIYGSSGKLYEQVSNGAPFHLYMSADIRYPELLAENGFAASAIYRYGVGRLVLWSKRRDLDRLGMDAFKQSWVKKIAIANPDHAPYGKRAVETLTYYQLYGDLRDKMVLGENISQAAQFASSGAADLGLIALSLAVAPAMKKFNRSHYLIPEESHSPLIQGAVITRYGADSDIAAAFMAYLQTEKAIAIFREFGFSQPTD
jgi:molybdate transport system substrate-binding protein